MSHIARESEDIRLIPIDRIEILNPRERNQKTFREIVASIKALGLKKPITVTRRGTGERERFMLVCGQGRVEAFQALGETEIPAQVIAASDEEAFVMSLVENIARRQTPATEQIETIRNLRQRGYDVATIARKTAQDLTWVRGILTLLDQGEDGPTDHGGRVWPGTASYSGQDCEFGRWTDSGSAAGQLRKRPAAGPKAADGATHHRETSAFWEEFWQTAYTVGTPAFFLGFGAGL
jgi:ParB/RepB/Spo0J family partition protein